MTETANPVLPAVELGERVLARLERALPVQDVLREFTASVQDLLGARKTGEATGTPNLRIHVERLAEIARQTGALLHHEAAVRFGNARLRFDDLNGYTPDGRAPDIGVHVPRGRLVCEG